MECDRFQQAISARLDGEAIGLEAAVLEHRLSTCSACRNWQDDAATVTRAVRVGSADAISDLTPAILAAIEQERVPMRHKVVMLRVALGLVALVSMFLGFRDLVIDKLDVHAGRDLASFNVALAVGLLCAAWRPVRAYGVFPLAAALVALVIFTTGAEGVGAYREVLGEWNHILQLAGLGLVWLLVRAVPTPLAIPSRSRRARLA